MERVFTFLDDLILSLPVSPGHRQLLQVHLRVGRERAEAWPQMSSIQLPLLVHAAITGDERPALPAAGACTLLYLGADLFDSILDHELPPLWRAHDSSEASLAATTLLGALPQISIARLQEGGTPPARLWTLAHLFADYGLTMGAGQYEDLLVPSLENVSIEDSRAMAEHKSGAEYALFAAAGATLATEDPSTIEAYAAFGSCFGIAQQLVNDAQDIWGHKRGQDLSNGKRTLPIVHALSTLRGERHERLQELLAVARESTEHHEGVRELLAAAGSPRYTALMVWLYQQQARAHLASASPREPAGRELYMLLDQASLLPQPTAT
ncbi:MAG: polyprenyl synthetase family protein [Actinomycetota bacterium]|nr:polyprenyl synthetase family protein [Actinomycetota bacterium]